MQNRQIVSGFSELKDLLIKKYKIGESRENIRLHFSMSGADLYLHNYRRHEEKIKLARIVAGKMANNLILRSNARDLVDVALKEKGPAEYLNQQFQLNGFFRF